MTNRPESYFRYWGKAEKDGAGYHLLVYHCLDVAAVDQHYGTSIEPFKKGFVTFSSVKKQKCQKRGC
jgi:CRISPR-associated endonuclease/helicase Cas3